MADDDDIRESVEGLDSGSADEATSPELFEDDALLDIDDDGDEEIGLDDGGFAPAAVVRQAPRFTPDEPNGFDFDDDDMDLDDEDLDFDDDIEFEDAGIDVPGARDAAARARMRQLEAATRALADAELDRDSRRIRRKVKASTGGAAVAGFVPILLQLVDALQLSPELAATASAGAAMIGSLVAGYSTPEPPPPVHPAAVVGVATPDRVRQVRVAAHRGRRRVRRRART